MPGQQEAHVLTSLTATSTQLLDGLRSPDNRTVWQQFVGRYRPMIFKYACRLGLRQGDAEDAAQNALMAFCEAYQGGQYNRGKGRLRSWLFGIARNQIRSTIRQLAEPEVQIVDQPDRTGFFDGVIDEDRWEGIWEQEWQQAVLHQCLEDARETLAPKTVEAFELFAWKGWTAKHVADHLGMSENAVYLAKYKILKRIRQLLPQMEEVW